MFAVPGWAVSAESLKPQIEPKIIKSPHDRNNDGSKNAEKKSKKRKRGQTVAVTAENLGDLWRKHVEHKGSEERNKESVGTVKRQKREKRRERTDTERESRTVKDDGFEGFSEKENTAGDAEEKSAPSQEKESKTEFIGEANGYDPGLDEPPITDRENRQALDGKTKYEQRKSKALRKREQKADLRANGILPPVRPEPTSDSATNVNQLKSLTVGQTPDPPKEPPPKSISPSHIQNTRVHDASKPSKPTTAASSLDQSPSMTKLTPLQQRMAAKLTSARFRHLNQTLYTSPSDQAMRLFADTPRAYESYHAGFRAQVAVWPQNPVEGFIEDLKTRGRASVPSQKKHYKEQKRAKRAKSDGNPDDRTKAATTKSEPLPRSRNGICTIADLGCGDAHLSSILEPLKKSLNLDILSFDLAKGDSPNAHLITVADITKLSAAGVKDGSLDIAICCLSLMGTNWVDVVNECAKAVRAGGEFWVAEIKSRFARPAQVKKSSSGDGIGKKKKTKKNGKAEDVIEDEDEDVQALEEIEYPQEAKTETTDVSAFVEVFRKRGFVPKDQPDLSNKMFVKIRFVKASSSSDKAAAASVAENNEKGGSARFGDGFKGKQQQQRMKRGRFLGEEELVMGGEVDENKVLKPCVYKVR